MSIPAAKHSDDDYERRLTVLRMSVVALENSVYQRRGDESAAALFQAEAERIAKLAEGMRRT